jgi:O-antigen/teichoic acid export membrane protein
MRLKGVLLMMIPIIASALMPVLSRTLEQDEAAYARLARDSIRSILAIGFVPTLALIVLADRVTVLLYGAEFAPGARVVAVIGPLVMLTYLSYLLAGQIALTTDGKKMTIATVTMLLLNVALNVTLVPMFGHLWPVAGAATGAAVATLIAESVAAALYAWLLPHKFMDLGMTVMLACIVVPLVLAMSLHGWLVEVPVTWRVGALIVLLPPYCIGTGILRIREIRDFLTKLRVAPANK